MSECWYWSGPARPKLFEAIFSQFGKNYNLELMHSNALHHAYLETTLQELSIGTKHITLGSILTLKIVAEV